MAPPTSAYRIEPATAERWQDVAEVMGTRGDPARCWCQYFHLRGAAWSNSAVAAKREALRTQVCGYDDRPPGVLAYADDAVVGWCQVGPKDSFVRLAASPISAAPAGDADPENLWAITCFVVPVPYRRRGAASALLAGAVQFAAAHGAAWVEGYPVDTGGARKSSADLYRGTVGQFEAAGFAMLRRPTRTHAVMRRAV